MQNSMLVWHTHYLPEEVVDNATILKKYPDGGTTIEEIYWKTGIKERRYVDKSITVSDIASHAVQKLLIQHNLSPHQVDKLIVGTFTSQYLAPTVAAQIMNNLSLNNWHGFDLNAACPSYITALKIWHNEIVTWWAKNVIVVWADTMSKVLQQWKIWDYKTWVIFWDWAGATLLTHNKNNIKKGIQWSYERTYNNFLFDEKYTGTRMLNAAKIHTNLSSDMPENWLLFDFNWLDIYRVCNKIVPKHIQDYLTINNLSLDDFDYIILHQANIKMLNIMEESLWLQWKNKVLSDIEYVWNTTSWSIPILLSRKMKSWEVTPWARAILCSFGAWINVSLIDTYL
jgi:3-oxoacyl-[acyl-carrier-protein] synthase-3